MTDYRKPRHDERLKPCPVCGGEPWADSKNGTIYCDCGLRLHLNGECHPEWHRMDWTADEWNGIAKLKEENAKLRKHLQSITDDYMHDNCGDCWGGICEECECWLANSIEDLRELGIEVDDD